jgi:hypothetical protein
VIETPHRESDATTAQFLCALFSPAQEAGADTQLARRLAHAHEIYVGLSGRAHVVACDGVLVSEPERPEEAQRIKLWRDGSGALVLLPGLIKVAPTGVPHVVAGDNRHAGGVQRVEDVIHIRARSVHQRLIGRRIARELEAESTDHVTNFVPNNSNPAKPSATR